MKLVVALALSAASTAVALPARTATSLLDAPDVAGGVPEKKALEKACRSGDAATCWLLGDGAAPSGTAVLQGASSPTTVRLSAWAPRPVQWSFLDLTARRRIVAERFERHKREDEAGQLLEFHFAKLRRGHDYRALAFDASGAFVDGRRFRVLAPREGRFRFAVAACLDDRYDDEQRRAWPQLWADEPDFLLLLGDNAYATRNRAGAPADADPDQLWRRQRESREKLLLYRQERLIPVFATWDDHDYGMRDGDASYPHSSIARDVHRAFFAVGPGADPMTLGPGVAVAFDVAGVRFVLADDRSFRAENDVWGAEQTRWLVERLGEGKKLAFFANGHPFFGGYHRFESVERHAPDAWKRLLADLARLPPAIVLLSGDRHLVELQRLEPALLGYETWELTSSAIHAKTYPDAWKEAPNPRQTDGKSGAPNYALVDVEPGKLRFRARGLDGATWFDRSTPVPRRR
jgi:hypothetical protein